MASYRASCRALMTGTFQFESWIDLHSFNTWSWNKVSWSIKHILVLPKYKQSVFCQRISQLHKIMTYVPNKWITYVLTPWIGWVAGWQGFSYSTSCSLASFSSCVSATFDYFVLFLLHAFPTTMTLSCFFFICFLPM